MPSNLLVITDYINCKSIYGMIMFWNFLCNRNAYTYYTSAKE